MIHDGRSYDPIQGQGHGDPTVVKMADFEVCLLCQYVQCESKKSPPTVF